METLQNFFTKVYALKNNKGLIISFVAMALIIFAFYQSVGVGVHSLSSLKSGIFSAFQGSVADNKEIASSELSTGGNDVNKEIAGNTSDAGWSIRKSVKGETIWAVYADSVRNNNDIVFKNQAINGLKNLTIIKNKIPVEKIKNNSLSAGVDYSFLDRKSADNFTKKINEANKQMQGGVKLKDLPSDLHSAYLIANAPSYQFLSSLQIDNINTLLE